MNIAPEDVLDAYFATTDALHKLWTEHVGKPGYRETDWVALSNALDRLGRKAATVAGVSVHEPLVRK